MNVNYLVSQLQLLPHPEGGYYKEVYRSAESIPAEVIPGFGGSRHIATSIYFLIEKDNFSALHKIKSDETWHFYYGDALEVIELDEHGNLIKTLVGNQLDKDQVF